MAEASEGFGAVLYARRISAGLSQQQLSERAGVSVRAVRDIERGRVRFPRPASVRRLALAVGLDPTDAIDSVRLSGGHRRDAPPLEIDVLGPLNVRRNGQTVEIGSMMQRSVLGLLSAQPDRLVGDEELIDALWGEHPPATCRNLVHTHVARLRGALDPDRTRARSDLIVAVGSGYRLRPEGAELDVVRFDELAEAGMHARIADPERARMLLSEAIACWRGAMLADLGSRVRHQPVVVAAGNRRLNAVLALADLANAAGKDESVVEQLRAMAGVESLHEGVHARLMVALAGSGQQAAALQVYAALRDRLADELGVAPGAEVQEAHARVLRRDTGHPGAVDHVGSPAPAQLPADVPRFAGRHQHMRELDELLAGDAESGAAVVITAIAGMAGVGKTALATHWAHRVADRFGDGQLYVNMNGYSAEAPLETLPVLERLLGELGVVPERVPADVEAAAALYRSRLAGKRMLILLDNVRNAEQVRLLLPGSGGSLVIVTSRDQLTGLVATHGVRRLSLDVLSVAEAVTLLREIVGPERIAAEPQAAEELARACGLLPLALRIAAAKLDSQPDQSISEYVGQLRAGNPLAELSVDGDPNAAVGAAFAASYMSLPAEARRLFRLLGTVPGPDVSVATATVLADEQPEAVARMLATLAKAHLVEPHAADRYGMHDLVRIYSRQQAEPDRDAALRRLLDEYLLVADSAVTILYPEVLLRLPTRGTPQTARFTDPVRAMAWFQAERDNLIAAVYHAAEHGPADKAWQIADALHCYFVLRGYAVEWPEVAIAGLNAASRAGDLRGQGAAHLSLGRAYQTVGRFLESTEHYTRAISLFEAAGLTAGQADARSNLGLTLWWMGDLDAAADELAIALPLAEQTGDRGCIGNTHLRIGVVFRDQGRLNDAADHQAMAIECYRRLGSKDGEAHALGTLGVSTHEMGRFEEAQTHLVRSLALMREVGDRFGETYVMRTLAAVHRDNGRYAAALVDAQAALALAIEIGHRFLEADARNVLGSVHMFLGHHEQANEQYLTALALARQAVMRAPEIGALLGLSACQKRAHPGDALEHARQALEIAQRGGFRVQEGWAHAALASCHIELCHYDVAEQHLRDAVAIRSRTSHRLGQEYLDNLQRSLSAGRRDRECM